jgi:predicted ATP-binding protein involved in virulence
MRINQISVKKLFGVFDHTIPLNVSDRITIIHGLNGCGKTILLKMIHGLFKSRYSEIRNIPFAEFRVDFDDGRYLTVTKAIEPQSEDYNYPTFKLYDNSNDSASEAFMPKLVAQDRHNLVNMIDEMVPGLSKISSSRWLDYRTEQELSLEEVVERYGYLTFDDIGQYYQEPDWLSNIKNYIEVNLIDIERLVKYAEEVRPIEFRSGSPLRRSMFLIPTVAKYAEKLAEEIDEVQNEYATLSQSLDRSFPTRVIKAKYKSDLTEAELRQQFQKVEEKRDRLTKLGLLEPEEKQDFLESEETIDEGTKTFLSLYLDDVKQKLNVFEEIADRLEVFQRMIQNRFKYKQMTVNPREGFSFTTAEGHPLSLTDLSSGEQHQLVLLYELLFKVEPNSLILIDEPELSLHLAWQIKFLEDLQEITQLGNFDVLMATHSPDIISDRWDLTVELKGPVA